MQKKQYEVCAEVLKRLHENRVLSHLVLTGSWWSVYLKVKWTHLSQKCLECFVHPGEKHYSRIWNLLDILIQQYIYAN